MKAVVQTEAIDKANALVAQGWKIEGFSYGPPNEQGQKTILLHMTKEKEDHQDKENGASVKSAKNGDQS